MSEGQEFAQMMKLPDSLRTWVECSQCDPDYRGRSYHDCGEDSCCCLDPEPNVICDTCDGKGGWYIDEWFGERITQDELGEILMWRENKQRLDFRAAMENWP